MELYLWIAIIFLVVVGLALTLSAPTGDSTRGLPRTRDYRRRQ